ncbi:MAG: inositol monophosphatase [Nocardioides sp.]|nr:inositol monophosphatase [Nocardioides sp.]
MTELVDLARLVAREAAELIADRRRAGITVAATKSSPVDIVTQADRDSEELIRDRLLTARPDDGFLGEEGNGVEGSSDVRWVVDPIDGTVNFLYGIPQYAVSIAAERDDEVVAGVVLNVATGVEYAAEHGGGSFRDGERLSVRESGPLAECLVLTGFNYVEEVRRRQAASWARLLPQVRDIRRLGSCALDLCHVAEGSADAYVEEGVSAWDHAAGALIAREAGARTELTLGSSGRETLICATRGRFAEFRSAVVSSGFLAHSEGSTGE